MEYFATKGLEYLIVIAFLASSIVFWKYLTARKH